MATSHPFETPVEGDVDVDIDEAVKEILAEMEVEEQDPLEGMGNAQITEIYRRMKPEDQRLFRQFKRFHKRYYETKGHDAPSHQLTRGIVQQMFPGLPGGRPLPRRGPNCWPQNDLRSCASSWDWWSQLSCRHIPHHQWPLSSRHHLNPHVSCQGGTRRGWQLNNNSLRKKLRPSRMSNLGGWPPHIWVPQDC